ncbi:helix-turn-helix transcriptional regulator [Actinacidiphila rubida]|uniref:Regulatory protein, luxR family n=1 Tax=Actinacidiphila rubida TaxID=310780 RepID=A0A1H8SI47_9ACTN|nr:helix-turn-helix transcriptional regulator [Actinacidiphila rubida]SEO78237.1 regulatory protein, luxR family [Actinacidiphila rubida]
MPGDEEWALAIYQALRTHGGISSEEELCKAAGVGADQAVRGRKRLHELGLAQVVDGVLEAVEPDTALVRTMDAYHANAAEQVRNATALQQLTQSLMTLYRPAATRDPAQVEVEYVIDRRRKDRTLVALESTTQRSVDAMHPGPMPSAQILETSLERDVALISRGVHLRALYPLVLLQSPRYSGYLQEMHDAGVEVRLLDHAPLDMIVHDRSSVCLPADPEHPGLAMLVVRGVALIRAYGAFYDDFWLRAVPYPAAAEPAGTGAAGLTLQERAVIRLMAGGLSDDQIARKMGVHRRTVQRAVAKLMERLNATSRFEAGLKLGQDPELVKALRPAPSGGPSVPAPP